MCPYQVEVKNKQSLINYILNLLQNVPACNGGSKQNGCEAYRVDISVFIRAGTLGSKVATINNCPSRHSVSRLQPVCTPAQGRNAELCAGHLLSNSHGEVQGIVLPQCSSVLCIRRCELPRCGEMVSGQGEALNGLQAVLGSVSLPTCLTEIETLPVLVRRPN